MPLDPQAQALIATFAGGKPVEQMTTREMRDAIEERIRLTGGQPEPCEEVLPSVLPGPGGAIAVRIYVPKTGRPPGQSLPGLVYFHGGGWARGSLQTHDIVCRSLANGGGCSVVSVDYRMAPEHRFPAAFQARPQRFDR
jgi:acetyl esterase